MPSTLGHLFLCLLSCLSIGDFALAQDRPETVCMPLQIETLGTDFKVLNRLHVTSFNKYDLYLIASPDAAYFNFLKCNEFDQPYNDHNSNALWEAYPQPLRSGRCELLSRHWLHRVHGRDVDAAQLEILQQAIDTLRDPAPVISAIDNLTDDEGFRGIAGVSASFALAGVIGYSNRKAITDSVKAGWRSNPAVRASRWTQRQWRRLRGGDPSAELKAANETHSGTQRKPGTLRRAALATTASITLFNLAVSDMTTYNGTREASNERETNLQMAKDTYTEHQLTDSSDPFSVAIVTGQDFITQSFHDAFLKVTEEYCPTVGDQPVY